MEMKYRGLWPNGDNIKLTLDEIARIDSGPMEYFMRLPMPRAFEEYKEYLETTIRPGHEGVCNQGDKREAVALLILFVQMKWYDEDMAKKYLESHTMVNSGTSLQKP